MKYHCTKLHQLTSFIIEPFIFMTNEFSAQLYHLKTFKTNPLGLRNNSLNCCWLPIEAHFLSLSLSSLDFFFFFFSVIRNNSINGLAHENIERISCNDISAIIVIYILGGPLSTVGLACARDPARAIAVASGLPGIVPLFSSSVVFKLSSTSLKMEDSS